MTSVAVTAPCRVIVNENPKGMTQSSMVKLPLQRLKPAINKYLKMLDTHMYRLCQHQCNMDKLTKTGQWTQLHQEQINAAGTTQQIKATLQELQRTRMQVVDNQVRDFYAVLQDFKVKVTVELSAFLRFCQGKPPEADDTKESDDSEPSSPDSVTTPGLTQDTPAVQVQTPPTTMLSPPDNSCAAASKEQLRQEMEELHSMVMCFVALITANATAYTEEPTRDEETEAVLPMSKEKGSDKTSKLKLAVFPVVGALLGGAVAGPVGLFTGIKIGTLAGSVGGGVAGLAGSSILKSQNRTSTTVPDVDQDNGNATTTEDAHASSQEPSTAENTSVVQHSATQRDSISMSQPSSLSSLSQTPSTQSPTDNRPEEPCADDSDDNGNMSMSLWDQIMFWGKGPE